MIPTGCDNPEMLPFVNSEKGSSYPLSLKYADMIGVQGAPGKLAGRLARAELWGRESHQGEFLDAARGVAVPR